MSPTRDIASCQRLNRNGNFTVSAWAMCLSDVLPSIFERINALIRVSSLGGGMYSASRFFRDSSERGYPCSDDWRNCAFVRWPSSAEETSVSHRQVYSSLTKSAIIRKKIRSPGSNSTGLGQGKRPGRKYQRY